MEGEKSLERIYEIKKKYAAEILSVDGVVGIGISEDEQGEMVIVVSVENISEELKEKIPNEIEGIRVILKETGKIKSMEDDEDGDKV